MKGRGSIIAILALGASSVGCTGVGPLAPADVEVVLMAESPVLTAIGARTQLQLQFADGVTPAGLGSIDWRSSAPTVALVDSDGIVTAMGEGVTTITAQVGGLSASTTITVAATIVNVARIRSDQTDTNAGNDAATVSVIVQAD